MVKGNSPREDTEGGTKMSKGQEMYEKQYEGFEIKCVKILISEIPNDKQISGEEIKSMFGVLFDYLENLEKKHSKETYKPYTEIQKEGEK